MINQHKNMYYCKTVKLLTCWGKLRKILEHICPWQVCGHLQQKSKWKIVEEIIRSKSNDGKFKNSDKQARSHGCFANAIFLWKSSGFPTWSSVSLTLIGIIIYQATKEMPCASKNPDSTDFSLNPLLNDFLDIFVLWTHNKKASQELRITTDTTKKRQT